MSDFFFCLLDFNRGQRVCNRSHVPLATATVRLVHAVIAFVICFASQPSSAQITPPVFPFVLEKLQCPTILDSATRAAPFAGNIPRSSAEPNDPIQSLAVRLNTGSGLMSNTDDEVWLDIGPKAWKIGNSFPSGSTQTFLVDLTTPDQAIDIPAVPQLRVKDIAVFRLEKKGICGLTNAPDSKYALAANEVSLEGVVRQLQNQVEIAQYGFQLKQTAVASAQQALDKADTALQSVQNDIQRASQDAQEIPGKIANIVTEVDQRTTQLALLPLTIAGQTCHDVRDVKPGVNLGSLLCVANPGACFFVHSVCTGVQVANPAIQQARDAINNLQKTRNDLIANAAALQIKIAGLTTSEVPLTAARMAAQKQLELVRAENTVAQRGLEVAKAGLEEGRKLAAKVPGIELPRIGQWNVESAALIVNGHELYNVRPNVTLRQGNPEWMASVKPMSVDEQFLRRLRMTLNRGNNSDRPNVDQIFAGALTGFKVAGFSGWLPSPVSRALVVGTLRNKPSVGTDGIVSLDLEIERVEVGKWAHTLGKGTDYGQRYIRAEYAFAANGRNDRRFDDWSPNDRLQISGEVVWDTDRNGFFEVHPSAQEDLRKVAPNETGGTWFFQRLFRGR